MDFHPSLGSLIFRWRCELGEYTTTTDDWAVITGMSWSQHKLNISYSIASKRRYS